MSILTRFHAFHSPCPQDGLDDDQAVAVMEIGEAIAQKRLSFTAVQCLCGCDDGHLVASYDRYGLWQPTVYCPHCGLLRSNPRMDDKSLEWFYSSDIYRRLYGGSVLFPPTMEKFQQAVPTGQRRFDVISNALAGKSVKRVAEIGCGAGWNLYPFHQTGAVVVGCDYSPELTAFGRGLGMDIRQGAADQLKQERFDLIILSHVLEHMPDPLAELERLLFQLEPDGTLYIEVPNARAFCLNTLQSAHIWYFAPEHLRDLLARLQMGAEGPIPMGPHFAMLFRRDLPVARPDLGREAVEMRRLIVSYDRRQRIKAILGYLGVLSLVQAFRG